MAQLFHPAMNSIAKASIGGLVLFLGVAGILGWNAQKSSYITDVGVSRHQPVPFSHKHHVGGLGIDCRYCHTSVESSPFAGLPATKVCMTCHSQIWTNAGMLEPVRDSWRTNTPIIWQRVNSLPNFVFFNHAIHVNKGIGCVSCHGQVDQMPLMYKAQSLQMEFCLDCHRNTEKALRPRSEVFNLHYDPAHDPDHPGATQDSLGRELQKLYHTPPRQELENCSTCHR